MQHFSNGLLCKTASKFVNKKITAVSYFILKKIIAADKYANDGFILYGNYAFFRTLAIELDFSSNHVYIIFF